MFATPIWYTDHKPLLRAIVIPGDFQDFAFIASRSLKAHKSSRFETRGRGVALRPEMLGPGAVFEEQVTLEGGVWPIPVYIHMYGYIIHIHVRMCMCICVYIIPLYSSPSF